tara:strand:+ start:7705 stop:8619 length:915 start_codon:yes stop_codon:yes gene_type:complete
MTRVVRAMSVYHVAATNGGKEGVEGVIQQLQSVCASDGEHNMNVLRSLLRQRLRTLGALKVKSSEGGAMFLQKRLKFVTLNCIDNALHLCLDRTLDLQRGVADDLVKFGLFQVNQITNNLVNDHAVGTQDEILCVNALKALKEIAGEANQCKRIASEWSIEDRTKKKAEILRSCKLMPSNASPPVFQSVHVRYDANPTPPVNDLKGMLQQQLNADLQHRIISPLIHRHLQKLLSDSQCDNLSQQCKEEVVGIFSAGMRPWVRAVMLDTDVDRKDVLGFLDAPETQGTGYDIDNKHNLMLRLMFV